MMLLLLTSLSDVAVDDDLNDADAADASRLALRSDALTL